MSALADQVQHGGSFTQVQEIKVAFRFKIGPQFFCHVFRSPPEAAVALGDEIDHTNPEHAVSYAMVMVAFALRELILFNQAPMFEKLVPVSDDHLRKELPRAFLRYLGVETE